MAISAGRDEIPGALDMFENDGGLAVFVDDDVEEVVEEKEEEEEEEEEEEARGGEVGCGWTSHKIWRGISVSIGLREI